MRAAVIPFVVAAILVVAGCRFHEPTLRGTVVDVVELEQHEERDESGKAYEPPLLPEVAWKVEVRLDEGGTLTVIKQGERRYEPGERVRVLIDEDGALLL